LYYGAEGKQRTQCGEAAHARPSKVHYAAAATSPQPLHEVLKAQGEHSPVILPRGTTGNSWGL
jgi:hypothetical protein